MALYSSTLPRAAETAKVIFHARPVSGWLGGVAIQNCGITEWSHVDRPDPPWVKARTWTLVRHNDASHVPSA